jgi:hypothetical protein
MDDALNHLMSIGAVMLAMVSVIGTFLIRRIVETASPGLRKLTDANDPGLTYGSTGARWWNEVALYALPPAVGGLISLSNIPYIFGDLGIETTGGRVIFGIVTGFFSGFLYKVFRKGAKRVTGVDIEPTRGGSIPPVDSAPPSSGDKT